MATNIKTSTLTLGANAMSIERNPIASNTPDLIVRENISGVTGVYNKKPNNGNIGHGVITGTYAFGETITGGTSGATAVLVGYIGTTRLVFKDIVGTFISGEVLTGGTSAATSTSNSTVTSTSYDGEWSYSYPVMTILQVEKTDGSRLNIELQEVSNQGTWNLGTQAALQQAITDINAWL